jgi:methylglutaconyl-CoA hydratase
LRYAFATVDAISSYQISNWYRSFVIEPAVSRKIGKTAMTIMTLEAHEWKTSAQGYDNGLYTRFLQMQLDIELAHFTQRLYNQMHLLEIEKIIWEVQTIGIHSC